MIQTDESIIAYSGNNSTTTPYVVPFLFFVDSDLNVVVTDAAGVERNLVLNTDFTVTGAGDPDGGNIKTTVAVPVTSRVTIFRIVPATQLTSYEEADAFPAKSHERALDKLTMLVQQALRGGGGDDAEGANGFRLTEASGGINAVTRINDTMLGVDANGKAILRTPSDLLAWLGQVGTVWPDDAARVNTRGAFVGQLGIQISNMTLYVATSTEPGAWVPYLPGTGIVAANAGTPNVVLRPAGDLVGTSEPQILANKTLNAPTISNPQGMVPADVGLDQVDNTGDKYKPLSDADVAALLLKQNLAERGVANGYPSLDGGGKVPLTQLPPESLGSNSYKGTWNASTNSPSITTGSAPGKPGWFYIVATAGTTTVDGISSWAVGDYIISNNVVWQKIGTSSAVTSVAGKTGAVTLVKGDVGLSNVENYSASDLAGLSQTVTNKLIDGATNTLNVRLGTSDVSGSLPVARLNNGTGAAANTFWCGDNSWKQPPGTGDVTGPPSSLDGDVAVFQGATGKLLKTISKPAADLVTGPSSAIDGRFAVFSGTSGKAIKMGSALMPAGSILDYAGTAEPSGWLFCDGRKLNQADFPALYSAIGTTYGAADLPLFIREAHSTASSGSSLTTSGFQSDGTNRLLLVFIYAFVTGDITINSITFNGVNLTRQIDWAAHTGTGIGEFSIWSLVNPPAVTADVVATFNKACSRAVMSAQIYNGVHQTTPLGTAVGTPLTATASAGSNLGVPSVEGDLIVDALLWSDAGTYTPTGAFQNEFYTTGAAATNGQLRGSQRPALPAPGTSTGMAWTRPSDKWSQIGVAIKPLSDPVFKLPDLRGRVAAGRDNMGGTVAARLVVETTGNVTAGSATITNIPSTASLARTMRVVGNGILPGTTIGTIASATSITLSENANATGTGVLLRFGVVDGMTLGSTGGAQSFALTKSEMPSHQHTTFWLLGGSGVPGGSGYAPTADGGVTGSTGGDDRHNNMQPTMVLNKIICTGT